MDDNELNVIYFGDEPSTVSTGGASTVFKMPLLSNEPPTPEQIKLGQEIARKYGLMEE